MIRPLAPRDAAAARALLAEVAGTPHGEGPADALARALDGASDESFGIVAARGDELVGLALAGLVAGAAGAGRMHLVVVTASARRAGLARALCDAAAESLRARGARLVVAELPDDPALASGRELLLRAGFKEEGRVADFYRDGVGMVILKRQLTGSGVRDPGSGNY